MVLYNYFHDLTPVGFPYCSLILNEQASYFFDLRGCLFADGLLDDLAFLLQFGFRYQIECLQVLLVNFLLFETIHFDFVLDQPLLVLLPFSTELQSL